jgi:hypothetical protein
MPTASFFLSTYSNLTTFFKVLCDKVCQLLAADLWFSPSSPVSSTKIDCHNITEILLKMQQNNSKEIQNHYLHILSKTVFQGA